MSARWFPKFRRRWTIAPLLALCLALFVVGCGDDRIALEPEVVPPPVAPAPPAPVVPQLVEASPPKALQELSDVLSVYQPQVEILSPRAGEVLADTTATVVLAARDLPVFRSAELEGGLQVRLALDDRPYLAVYDLDRPLVLKDLTPGTHTLRAFAATPWGESFKNEGAYAQTTFHIFAKDGHNTPAPDLPLLTYNSPQGTYGAEPILLDFYLTNAPLHLVAREDPADEIVDWRVRVTANDQSFVLDRWEPIYLKGFHEGTNWVKLEFLDEFGEPVENVFNTTVRAIAYNPGGGDIVSRLTRGELSAADARGLVDPNYVRSPETEAFPEAPLEETPLEPEAIPEAEAPEVPVEKILLLEEELLPETVEEPAAPEKPAEESIEEPAEIAPEEPEVVEPPEAEIVPEPSEEALFQEKDPANVPEVESAEESVPSGSAELEETVPEEAATTEAAEEPEAMPAEEAIETFDDEETMDSFVEETAIDAPDF